MIRWAGEQFCKGMEACIYAGGPVFRIAFVSMKWFCSAGVHVFKFVKLCI